MQSFLIAFESSDVEKRDFGDVENEGTHPVTRKFEEYPGVTTRKPHGSASLECRAFSRVIDFLLQKCTVL